jgi:hypothetical protein
MVDRIWIDVNEAGSRDIDTKPYKGASPWVRLTPELEALMEAARNPALAHSMRTLEKNVAEQTLALYALAFARSEEGK